MGNDTPTQQGMARQGKSMFQASGVLRATQGATRHLLDFYKNGVISV